MKSEELVDEALKGVSSFSERLGKEEYFTGAGHLNILVNLRRDIAARVPLLVLTGGEGCGKSVLARMAASEVRGGCITVYLDQGIDSFEDLIGTMAERLGIELAAMTRDTVAEAMDRIAAALAGRNQRLLLICDGAERIYLATLERLRKMMDRLNRVEVSLQVVLIGRPVLLDNLRQLSICNFEEIEERRYVLEQLTPSETRSYLEFCKKKLAEEERSIFTPESIERIYRESGGNFKKIHQLAEQLCNRYNKDASFWVLLENVEGGAMENALARVRTWPRLHALRRIDPRRLLRRQQPVVTAAVVCALLVLILLAWPERQPAEQPTKSDDQTVLQPSLTGESEAGGAELTEDPVADLPPGPQPQQPLPQVAVAPDAAAHPEPGGLVAENATVQSSEVAADSAGQVEDAAVTEQEVDPAMQQLLEAEMLLSEAREAVETAKRDTGPELVGQQATGKSGGQASASAADAESVPLQTNGIKILPVRVVEKAFLPAEHAGVPVPVLRQERSKKMGADSGGEGPASVVEAEELEPTTGSGSLEAGVPVIRRGQSKLKQEVIPGAGGVAGAPVVEEGPRTATGSRVLGPLEAEAKKIPFLAKAIISEKKLVRDSRTYLSRVAAGKPWLAGSNDGRYTLQLMALSSDMAQENVQEILSRDGHAAAADQLYIFEKKSGEPAVFVFFGEYDSPADARAARETLPAVLEKYQPYVLSVGEAMQKVR